MDMPISQINNRLNTRLPDEYDLGLLFAVGTVSQVVFASGGRPIQFTLRHAGYALRCKVAPSMILTFPLVEGREVRAVGHLSFSAQAAQFHLLVRDLEPLPDTILFESAVAPPALVPVTERRIIPEWLLNIQKRAQAAPEPLAPAEIPEWVHEMAPPEAQIITPQAINVLWGSQRAAAALEPPPMAEENGVTLFERDEELFQLLLSVLERSEHEEVELDAQTLAQLLPSQSETNDDEPPAVPSPMPAEVDGPRVTDATTPPPAVDERVVASSMRALPATFWVVLALFLVFGTALVLLYLASQIGLL